MDAGSGIGPRHVMAVIGGAVSGAEAAATLVDAGIEVVVFEQNVRPYGKIEDGLPRWHDRQRRQEYDRINAKLSKPGVHFVPQVKLGGDIQFRELLEQWGFNAVLLAIGAWRDRPLGVEGCDEFIGKGLVYQNSLIHWFNHYHEKGYDGPRYEMADGAIVIGGGLASIDAIKVVMLETVGKALGERGIRPPVPMFEHKGISGILAEHGLSMQELGLKGATLFYRRRAIDMPVASYKEHPTPEEMRKTEEVRLRLLHHAMEKFLFKFEQNRCPNGLIVEDGRLAGIRFRKTEVREGKVVTLEEPELGVRAPLVISSIGSIPEPIPGVPTKGEFYAFGEGGAAKLKGHDNVYGVGNVVTGKGNIAVSRKHGGQVAQTILEEYGAWPPFGDAENRAHAQAEAIARDVKARAPLAGERVAQVLQRVRELQQKVGYEGDYGSYIKRVTPEDME